MGLSRSKNKYWLMGAFLLALCLLFLLIYSKDKYKQNNNIEYKEPLTEEGIKPDSVNKDKVEEESAALLNEQSLIKTTDKPSSSSPNSQEEEWPAALAGETGSKEASEHRIEYYINNQTEIIASQINTYLIDYPDKTIEELREDENFQEIVFQTIGQNGYGAIADPETKFLKMHPNADLLDRDLSFMEENYPVWWNLYLESLTDNRCGLYSWPNESGEKEIKYLCTQRLSQKIEGKNLVFALTAKAKEIEEILVNQTKNSNEKDNLEDIGENTARLFVGLLDRAVEDTLEISRINFDDILSAKEKIISFLDGRKRETWYNLGTDLDPIEQKKTIPVYSQIEITDKNGQEIIKYVNGEFAGELKDISNPANTEYKSETYFKEAENLPAGIVNIGKVMTKYTFKEDVFKNSPPEDFDKYEKVIDRDTIKKGVVRFSTPLYKNGKFSGIAVLSLDYRHLQELSKHIDPGLDIPTVSSSYTGNYLLIFDIDGNTIVHPKPDNIRGYLENGELAGYNEENSARPGSIFNLYKYQKSETYSQIAQSVLMEKQPYSSAAVDVSGRQKLTVAVPILYANPKTNYRETGVWGGIMMSINTGEPEENNYNVLKIKLSALETARQIEEYIKSHPEKTITELQADEVFTNIAVQPVGNTGYTAVLDSDSGYYYFHPQESLINTDSHNLESELPEAWNILSKAIGTECQDSEGVYNWREEDGVVTKKYMYLTCIRTPTADGKKLFIAATTYLDEESAASYLDKYSIVSDLTLVKSAIKQKAIDVAKQIEIYIRAHPDKTVKDMQNDEYFQNIAVQSVGKTGYTAVTDFDTLVCRFHKNPDIIDLDLHTLANKLPGFWSIMSRAKSGFSADGEYDWEESDGTVKRKYLYIEPVAIKTADKVGLNVAATTYLDEYEIEPAPTIQEPAEEQMNLTNWFLAILFLLFAVIFIIYRLKFIHFEKFTILSLLFIALVLIMGIFVVNAYYNSNKLKKDTINRYVEQYFQYAQFQAEEIRVVLEGLNEELDYISREDADVEIESLTMDEILKSSYERKKDNVYASYRIDRNGIIANMYPRDSSALGSDISEQDYMVKIKQEQKPATSGVFKAVEGFFGVTTQYPVIKEGVYDGTFAFLVNIDDFLEQIQLFSEDTIYSSVFLVDQSGVIVYSKTKGYQGKNIKEEEFLGQLSQGIDKIINAEFPGYIKDINDDKSNLILYYPFEINNNKWKFIINLDLNTILQETNKSFNEIWKFTILVVMAIIFIGAIFVLLLTKSLRREVEKKTQEIKKKAEQIAIQLTKQEKDSKNKVKILKDQEIIRKKLEEKRLELEKVISGVEKDRGELESQRQAILNILEDISESKEELKTSNEKLEKKSNELAALKSLSDELASILEVEEAIKIVNKYIIEFIPISTISFLVINPGDEGGIKYKTHIVKSVSELYLADCEKALVKFINKSQTENKEVILKVLENIKAETSGEKLDNQNPGTPGHIDHFSLIIGGKHLGVVQLTKKEKGSLNKENEELINTIIIAAAYSIDRLQTLIITQHSKTVSLVESLRDGVIMFNDNEDIVLMNPAFEKYTGFSSDYFSLEDLYRLMEGVDMRDMVKQALKKGKVSHIQELKLVKKYYEVFITPVRDNTKKIVGGAVIIHDITYLKEIDQMKTEFVSVASHQLRTPLTAIKLFTDMLKKEEVGKLNSGQKEYLVNVHESTERMVRLVNDLLNVTRIESGRLSINPSMVDLAEFINNIISEAQPLADSQEQKINFKVKDKDLPKVPLDQNLMRQVIHNLVVNAIRYSPPKTGIIEVELLRKGEDKFVISVKDNGIGIPQKFQRRIFEKFYRADNAVKSVTEGTGLGLYVSKMIVESSGGKISFKSKQGHGTIFYVEMPTAGMKEKKGERSMVIS